MVLVPSLNFPRILVLENNGQVTGRETIKSHQTRVFYHDHYFLPSSRRGSSSTGQFKRTRSLDLQSVTLRRVGLKAGMDWKAAQEQRAALLEEVQAELAGGPHQLDPRGCFEVDWSGAPRAILLRLKTSTDLPLAGWTTLAERPGVGMPLSQLAHLDIGRLAILRRDLPRDAKPGVPYALLDESGRFKVQLFVSYSVGE